jgi:hypothetical protein
MNKKQRATIKTIDAYLMYSQTSIAVHLLNDLLEKATTERSRSALLAYGKKNKLL